MKKMTGFTLIELLVVISIMALLSTLAVVSLNNAREKSRDVKRLGDVNRLQYALELYFNEHSGYPVEASTITLGATDSACFDSAGFTTIAACSDTPYMGLVPSAPTPPSSSAYTYVSADGSTYTMAFTLEGVTSGLATGTHNATPYGIQ